LPLQPCSPRCTAGQVLCWANGLSLAATKRAEEEDVVLLAEGEQPGGLQHESEEDALAVHGEGHRRPRRQPKGNKRYRAEDFVADIDQLQAAHGPGEKQEEAQLGPRKRGKPPKASRPAASPAAGGAATMGIDTLNMGLGAPHDLMQSQLLRHDVHPTTLLSSGELEIGHDDAAAAAVDLHQIHIVGSMTAEEEQGAREPGTLLHCYVMSAEGSQRAVLYVLI
jgi:hypothetical protein